MFHLRTLKLLIIILYAICIQTNNAQEINVIDKKGTINKVNNNILTISNNAPIVPAPFKGDIWINNSSNAIKIYDGANWVDITHIGTQGSIFFANTNGTPTENNAQLFWDNTNNRLGVGTDSPDNKLHVSGAIRSAGILNSNGNAGEPSFRFNNDTDTGIFRPNLVDQMGFSAGGIEALHIAEDANITTVTIKDILKLEEQLLDEDNLAGTVGQVLTATATGTKWKDAYKAVTNELIFDGADDGVGNPNENFRYVSLIVDGEWKVIRYDKTDVNVEEVATIANNAGIVNQPTTLAECTALNYI